MRQTIQADFVGILVLGFRLDFEGLHAGIALLGGDVLGILLTENSFWELPGLPFISGAVLFRLENGVFPCRGHTLSNILARALHLRRAAKVNKIQPKQFVCHES